MNIKFIFKLFIFIFFLLIIGCKQNFEQPKSFRSYHEVELFLEKGKFSIDESTNTSKSDWITSANYKSLDGKIGFLTLGMRGKDYYFKDVPIDIWNKFKLAESKGKFYHRHIKGNYKIKIE